jgi:hypothetical protein
MPAVVIGEKLLCGFVWDMSGIDVHANTNIGHHMSTLVRTMTTITTDFEAHDVHKSRKPSSLSSPKTQSSRHLRKTPSTSRVHKRSMSVLQRPSPADTNYKNALEQELAKQTRRVQQLRFSGAAGDSVKVEEAMLRTTEQELAKTVQRMFRHPRSGLSLQVFNQIFNPLPKPTRERSAGRLSVATRLFSLSEKDEGGGGRGSTPSSPMRTGTRTTQAKKLGHRRYTSDVTGFRATHSPSPTASEEEKRGEHEDKGKEVEGEASEGDAFEDQSASGDGVEAAPSKERFALPSIDLEFDVTVNVDRGKIVLRTEERLVSLQLAQG